MKISKNIQCFLSCESQYKDSKMVLYGAPFDGTCSYRPGTRFAPSAIRNESYGIETYSPYIDKDLSEVKVFDCGDLDLPFGNTKKVLQLVKKQTAKILSDDKFPLLIGGEHLLTLPAVEAVFEKYPDLVIVHFDAHTDLRDEYIGEKLSHSTVIRRCHDLLGDGKIFQFGIRSGERYEFEFAARHTNLTKFGFNGIENIKNKIGNSPVYFTLDLDVLDSSVFPATGTPEAGGASFNELINAITIISKLNVVAADIMELSPTYDFSGASTAVACKTLREMILNLYK